MDPDKFEDADLEKFKPKWIRRTATESVCLMDIYGREALTHKFERLRARLKRRSGGYPYRIINVRRILCGPRNVNSVTGQVTRHFWDVSVHIEFTGIE